MAAGALGQDAPNIGNLEKDAKKGDVIAKYQLALAYADAYRVERDYDQSIEWLEKAGEQGDPMAPYTLSVLCHNGEGVERDVVAALQWISLAAANPPVEYPKEYGWARDDMARVLDAEQHAEVRRRLDQWRPKTWAELSAAEEGLLAAESAPR